MSLLFRKKDPKTEEKERTPTDWKAIYGDIRENINTLTHALGKAREKAKDLPGTNYELGKQFRDQGKLRDAIGRFRLAVKLDPTHVDAYVALGACQLEIGNHGAGVDALRKALALAPTQEEAHYLLAVVGEALFPPCAPTHIIERLFDAAAPHFEEAYVKALHYAGPDLIGEYSKRLLPPERKHLNVLDLGCGTGLAGQKLRHRASYLRGVDLSARMLDEARKKKSGTTSLYDSLIHMDMAEYLEKPDNHTYDVIIATGAFNYMGDVTPLFPAIARHLIPGGLFFCSVELAQGDEPMEMVKGAGRYRHSAGFLRHAAQVAELKEQALEQVSLYEGIAGLLGVWTKPTSGESAVVAD